MQGRRWRAPILGGLSTLALTGCGDGAALDRLAAGPVVMAVDAVTGDTLALRDGRRLRLSGVEAPLAGQPYAELSRRELSRLASRRALRLSSGSPVLGDSGGGTAPLMAQVRLVSGRRWLEGALLDAGAVRVRTTAEDRALAREMLAREAEARREGRGLWGLADYGVRLPDEVEPRDHGLMLVEGRVLKAGSWRGAFYLDFARDWRRGVSVHMPHGALRDFRDAGLDPLQLEGRLVRVRGELSWTDGAPVLAVDHPEQIAQLVDGARR